MRATPAGGRVYPATGGGALMPRSLVRFVHAVDSVNYMVGRVAMYLLFAMFAVLVWSIGAKVFHRPPLWAMEMTEYLFVGYYLLGGAYSLILGANVRMDLLYTNWSPRKRAAINAVTGLGLLFFLGVIVFGGIESVIYSIENNQHSSSAWRPHLAPIKIIICIGAFQMLMQSISFLIRDIATVRGVPISQEIGILRLSLRNGLHLSRDTVRLDVELGA